MNRLYLAITAAALLVAPLASAEIVDSGSAPFAEPNGFYTGTKSYIVYTHDDMANPAPGVAGEFTYVYTITNDPGSLLGLIGFNIDAPVDSIVAAGSIDDGNPATPAPFQVINNNDGVVRWDWAAPDIIAVGQVADQLYLISPFRPGTVGDTVYSIEGDFAFDVESTCVGPNVPPTTTGEALPCTIGYWKNRADGKQGTIQHFPEDDFSAIVTAAVGLAGGLFVDEADLLANLRSKGKRSILERGRQQLAATFLNLAAGEEFPDNTKCKLFGLNGITSNACGDAITIGAAITQTLTDIAGDIDAQHNAQECSDDINNGIGVVDSL